MLFISNKNYKEYHLSIYNIHKGFLCLVKLQARSVM